MRAPAIVMGLAAALPLAGCVSILGPRLGSELVGRSAQLTPTRGQSSTLFFQQDGQVRAAFGRGQANGRWWVRSRRLCFQWGATRECWPYRSALRPGETRTIRSDRGNVVQVTLR